MSVLTGEIADRDATCPTCSLDVGGYSIGVTTDGRTTWDRPSDTALGPTGTEFRYGGLTHVEGGRRCKAS